jgi:hypothetical protein
MAQRKDSPNSKGGGNAKSSGTGGGKGARSQTSAQPAGNTTVRHEKASPSGRDRGETSHADRS